MKNLFTLSLIVLLLGLVSCESGPGTMTVQGTLENGAGKTAYIQLFDESASADSVTIGADGTFAIKMTNPTLDFFRFFVDKAQNPVVMVFDSTQQNIHITGDADNLMNTYSVSGSEDSELLKKFFDLTDGFRIKVDSVNRLQQQLPTEIDPIIRQALSRQTAQMQESFETEIKELAMANTSSPAALSIISAIDIRKAFPEYKKIAGDLKTVIPNSPYLTSMADRVNQMELALAQEEKKKSAMASLAPGGTAPEIDLQAPTGEFVSLSSMKGKYVLIDFWASWCGPCRRENPNVVKLYEKYGGDNFEILGVSLDSSKDRWLQAIEKDQLNWKHVSDLKKWNSVAAADYGVRSIPFTVLVDPEGKVVATKLRGKALEDKLSELFGA